MNYVNIAMDIEEDIIFLTVGKYKLFMSHGATGRDAKSLYEHLMFTAKMQKTNQVKATNSYLKKGLCMGDEKIRKAKKLLLDLGLITLVEKRDKQGKFTEHYIKVHAKTVPNEVKEEKNDPETLKSSSGKTHLSETRNKCFNEKEKCLNEKDKIYTSFLEKIYEFWITQKGTIKHRSFEQVVNNTSRKKLENNILKFYAPKEIGKAILNYVEVLNGCMYYYNHKWTLWDFLNRGYKKFVDESEPLQNFKSGVKEKIKKVEIMPQL